MLTITNIEDGLLALPEYQGMPRASESLRQMSLYLAALYGANYLKLLSFSKYPAEFVKLVADKLLDNDVVVDGKVTESFVRIRVKGAGKLIDQILGKTAEPVPAIVKAPALKAKGKAKKQKEQGRNIAALMREGIWAAAKQANGAGFSWNDVYSYLQSKGHQGIGDCRANYTYEVKRLVRRGELVCLQTGTGSTNPKPSIYAIPVNTRKLIDAMVKPKPVTIPAPSESITITVPESPVTVRAELLPGPQPSAALDLLDRLICLKNSRLADAEAVARVITILQGR